MKPFRLLQITDCHLGGTPGEALLGLDTDQSLHDVMQSIQEKEVPDLILATGDISNDGSVSSYERFLSIVKNYFPNTPLAWLPGNHDDPESMSQVEELPIEQCYSCEGWNFLFLDSRIPKKTGGDINTKELQKLKCALQEGKDTATLLFMHHQPVPVGSEWVDQYAILDPSGFFGLVDQYKNIKCISWGHVHQEFSSRRKGVELLATPSTCVQFVADRDDFQVDRKMPGYRRIECFPDGTYTTEVVRIEHKAYSIDFASTGY